MIEKLMDDNAVTDEDKVENRFLIGENVKMAQIIQQEIDL